MTRLLRTRWAALALLLALVASPAASQSSSGQTLRVATHEAAPFAMKGPDGVWSGPAISLWQDIAADLGLAYEITEVPLAEMVDGVAEGRFDAAVGAMTVTPQREARIDFTHPYYTTGFGIATSRAPPSWLALLRNFFTWQFFQAVLLLGAVLLAVGALFWWVERRANDDQFEPGWKGIASGFWFSAVTMTTVGYGDKSPRTPAGKLIATVWMFAAIIIISTFTGMIASSLTANRLSGAIRNADDLQTARVGSIRGTAAQEWLDRRGVSFRDFETIQEGLDAVAAHRIDAFVYDRPLLRYVVHEAYDEDLQLVSGTFGRQDYALILPQGSDLREAVNEALLRRISTRQWSSYVSQTLGTDE